MAFLFALPSPPVIARHEAIANRTETCSNWRKYEGPAKSGKATCAFFNQNNSYHGV